MENHSLSRRSVPAAQELIVAGGAENLVAPVAKLVGATALDAQSSVEASLPQAALYQHRRDLRGI